VTTRRELKTGKIWVIAGQKPAAAKREKEGPSKRDKIGGYVPARRKEKENFLRAGLEDAKRCPKGGGKVVP